MNLYAKLCEREAAGRPVAVGVIGAGKFGTMFLAQARLTRGLHVVGVVDLDPARARAQLAAAGWDAPRYAAASLGEALRTGRTHVGPDAEALFALAELEVIVEATGVPAAGIRHALAAIRHGKHVVMVNVEADALVGPLLARKAQQAGLVYSLAWGDQPALICEQVDWARACGFHVVAAGKGTRYEPHYHRSTPDTVWVLPNSILRNWPGSAPTVAVASAMRTSNRPAPTASMVSTRPTMSARTNASSIAARGISTLCSIAISFARTSIARASARTR